MASGKLRGRLPGAPPALPRTFILAECRMRSEHARHSTSCKWLIRQESCNKIEVFSAFSSMPHQWRSRPEHHRNRTRLLFRVRTASWIDGSALPSARSAVRPVREATSPEQPLPLTQALKWRGVDISTASAISRDAPDFSRFAALVAAYPDRRRRRRSSEIGLKCRHG
jgi:hypothetical protein